MRPNTHISKMPQDTSEKVAIYQGFDCFHYEMIGYALEYCLKRGLKVTVYAHATQGEGAGWRAYYRRVFGDSELAFYSPMEFEPFTYDTVFLLTDDDRHYHSNWLMRTKPRVICIDHFHSIRREGAAMYHVGTRFFPTNPRPWALPCYEAAVPNIEAKREAVSHGRVIVACVGVSGVPREVGVLKKLLGRAWDSLEVHIIGRYVVMADECADANVHIHKMASPDAMADILRRATHVLFLHDPPVEKRNQYPEQIMSGTIPLALTYGCQMILPDSWNAAYRFSSPVVYSKEQTIDLSHASFLESLPAVFEERACLIAGRDAAFDAARGLFQQTFDEVVHRYGGGGGGDCRAEANEI